MCKILILSIGIDGYKSIELEKLDFCVNDAGAIYHKYSRFNTIYKKLLVNQDATKTEIEKAIEAIKNIARDNDYIIFNYSGHGTTTEINSDNINSTNSYLCAYDFDTNFPNSTGISFDKLKSLFNEIPASKFLIIDACHSGSMAKKSSRLRELSIDKLIETLGDIKDTGIMTACDSKESALEYTEMEQGYFTYYLIEILENMKCENYLVPFADVYRQVSEKVKLATRDFQHPKAKYDEDFKILTIHKGGIMRKLDTSLVPTTKPQPYITNKMRDFEKHVIQLIQENRFIEINILLKDIVNKICDRITNPDISLNSEKSDEIIHYYESCREYINPLTILINHIIEYYDEKYILDNIEYIFQIERLTHDKSGNLAIIAIPMIIMSEIFFKFIPKAYEKRRVNILKVLVNREITDDRIIRPIIYDPRIWGPIIFKSDVDIFMKYLFPDEVINNNFIAAYDLRNLNEIIFLIDCYSKVDEKYYSHPTYLTFNDIDVLDRIYLKLNDTNFRTFIEKIFSVEFKRFLELIIQRQKQILEWRKNDIHSIQIRYSMPKYIAKFEELYSKLK